MGVNLGVVRDSGNKFEAWMSCVEFVVALSSALFVRSFCGCDPRWRLSSLLVLSSATQLPLIITPRPA